MTVDKVPFLDLCAAYLELKPHLDAAYQRVMNSGWYVLGTETERFEQMFAAFCDSTYCVGVSNGLDALSLSLLAGGVEPGDEVIVPAHTFIATWLAVSRIGAIPVAVDVCRDNFNIDADLIEAAVSPRTRAIIPVHLYGYPADMDSILAVARRRDVMVIEDAAQAHGTRYRGRKAGSFGHAAAFSFYPGKNLGAFGDGGAVVTRDASIAERLLLLRNYGSRKKYVHEVVGFNARLDELQAALLAEKLVMLEEWNRRRQRIAGRYREAFAGHDTVQSPPVSDDTESSFHLFVIRHPAREQLREWLNTQGVETLVHYPFLPAEAGAYEDMLLDVASYPVATDISRTVLSLPIFPHMNDRQVDKVIDAVLSFR